jgi:hypothetical protein
MIVKKQKGESVWKIEELKGLYGWGAKDLSPGATRGPPGAYPKRKPWFLMQGQGEMGVKVFPGYYDIIN